jgi:hypothetical protein
MQWDVAVVRGLVLQMEGVMILPFTSGIRIVVVISKWFSGIDLRGFKKNALVRGLMVWNIMVDVRPTGLNNSKHDRYYH